MLVSLLTETGALLAPLEPSSPATSLLLLSTSSAQSERFLVVVQLPVLQMKEHFRNFPVLAYAA